MQKFHVSRISVKVYQIFSSNLQFKVDQFRQSVKSFQLRFSVRITADSRGASFCRMNAIHTSDTELTKTDWPHFKLWRNFMDDYNIGGQQSWDPLVLISKTKIYWNHSSTAMPLDCLEFYKRPPAPISQLRMATMPENISYPTNFG